MFSVYTPLAAAAVVSRRHFLGSEKDKESYFLPSRNIFRVESRLKTNKSSADLLAWMGFGAAADSLAHIEHLLSAAFMR